MVRGICKGRNSELDALNCMVMRADHEISLSCAGILEYGCDLPIVIMPLTKP
jgi:hypothetical protein